MKGLEFSTVVMVGSFLILALLVPTINTIRISGRNAGLWFSVAGLILLAGSCLPGGVEFSTRRVTILWSYISIAASIFAVALILGGIHLALGKSRAVRWYGLIVLTHLLSVAVMYYWFRLYLGYRTALFSFSSILLVLPMLKRRLRMTMGTSHPYIFNILLSAFGLLSALRMAFGLLDPRKDKFLPSGIDSWLYLLIIVAGLGILVIALRVIANGSRSTPAVPVAGGRPVISLSEYGLTAAEIRCTMAFLGGKSAKEIAAESGLSSSTIRNTLSHAYQKLGVPNMVSLTVLAGDNEIVE